MVGQGANFEPCLFDEGIETRAGSGLDLVGALDMLRLKVVADIGVDALVTHGGDRPRPLADMGDRHVSRELPGNRTGGMEHRSVGLRLYQQGENGPRRHRSPLPRERYPRAVPFSI